MNYEIKWEDNGVCVLLFNEVNEQFIEFVNELLITNENFEKIRYQVWDFAEVDNYYLDSEKGREIGALDKEASIWNKEMKVAIVTENESLIAYTKNYIEEIKDTAWQCKLFSKIDKAREWAMNSKI